MRIEYVKAGLFALGRLQARNHCHEVADGDEEGRCLTYSFPGKVKIQPKLYASVHSNVRRRISVEPAIV